MFTELSGFVSGPLVSRRQSGFEQRWPALFARTRSTGLVKSARTMVATDRGYLKEKSTRNQACQILLPGPVFHSCWAGSGDGSRLPVMRKRKCLGRRITDSKLDEIAVHPSGDHGR